MLWDRNVVKYVSLFIGWDGLWCPCCGYRLRTKPRNLKYKAKLKARKEIEESKILLHGTACAKECPKVIE